MALQKPNPRAKPIRYFSQPGQVHPYKGTSVAYAQNKGYWARPQGMQQRAGKPVNTTGIKPWPYGAPPGAPKAGTMPPLNTPLWQDPAGSNAPGGAQTAPGGAPGGSPATDKPDYTTDPMYARALGAYQTRMGTAGAGRLAEQKRLLLGFGSQEMARGILGDDPFVNTVSADPLSSFSTLANIGREYGQNVSQLEGQLGEGNLAFGSARVGGMTRLGTERMQNEAEQRRLVENALRDVQGAYTTEANAAGTDLLTAEQQAYENALSSTAQAAEVEDPTGDANNPTPGTKTLAPAPNLVKPGPTGKGYLYKAQAQKNLRPGQQIYYKGGKYYVGPKR